MLLIAKLIMSDKKQKSCLKRIHLVTDDHLCDRKAFFQSRNCFYSCSMNDSEFISYYYPTETCRQYLYQNRIIR